MPTLPVPFPPPEPVPRSSWTGPLAAAAVLATLVFLLYRPAVDFRLTAYDDPGFTWRNPLAARGLDWESIVRAFADLSESEKDTIYIPVTNLSFMADVELYGMSPRGFHLTNVLLHAANMAILLLLLWRMTGSLARSALAAAFVAFHPLRVESVAWVAERKDVLSTLFLLLAVAGYVRYARTRRPVWYLATFLAFVAGVLSKPILVVLPVLLLLVDFWPLGRMYRGPGEGAPHLPHSRLPALLLEKLPLVAVSVLASRLTLHLHGEIVHGEASLPSRIGHALVAPFIYLYQTAFPVDLMIRFVQPAWDRASPWQLPAVAATVALAFLLLLAARRAPAVTFGGFWFLVALLPVGGIVGFGSQWISDRFTYVPSVGLAVALAWAVGLPGARRGFRFLRWGLAWALVVPLAFLSRQQLYAWKDGAAMFSRGAARWPDHPPYRNQYAMELLNLGDVRGAGDQATLLMPYATHPGIGEVLQNNLLEIAEASGDRGRVVALARDFLLRSPPYWWTRYRLAEALRLEGRFGEAAVEYRLLLEEGKPRRRYEREYALEGLADSLDRLGEDREALRLLAAAENEFPGGTGILRIHGRLLARLGRAQEAKARCEAVLRADPDDLEARWILAGALLAEGEVAEGVAQFEEVARRAPGRAEEFAARGRVLEAAGRKAEAAALYRESLGAEPLLPDTLPRVRNRLGLLGR